MSDAKKHLAEAGRLITEASEHSRAGQAWKAIGLLAEAYAEALRAVKAAAREKAEADAAPPAPVVTVTVVKRRKRLDPTLN